MAAENNEQDNAAKDSAPLAPNGGVNKIVVITSLVNMVATVGIVAVLVLAHQREKSKPTVEDIVSGQQKAGGHGKGGHGDAKKEGGHGGGGGH